MKTKTCFCCTPKSCTEEALNKEGRGFGRSVECSYRGMSPGKPLSTSGDDVKALRKGLGRYDLRLEPKQTVFYGKTN